MLYAFDFKVKDISYLLIYLSLTYDVPITKVSWCFQLTKIIINSGLINIYLSHYLIIYIRPMFFIIKVSWCSQLVKIIINSGFINIYLSHYLSISDLWCSSLKSADVSSWSRSLLIQASWISIYLTI